MSKQRNPVAAALEGIADLLGQIHSRMPTLKGPMGHRREAAERFAEEERRAWDMYAAGAVAGDARAPSSIHSAAADGMLAERRKRFPPPDGDTVPVQRSLLEAIVAVGKTEGLEGLRPLLAQLGEAMKCQTNAVQEKP